MIVLCVLCVLLVIVRELTVMRERHEWCAERRELLNRVQAPERVPFERVEFVVPEPELDEFALVGQVGEVSNG